MIDRPGLLPDLKLLASLAVLAFIAVDSSACRREKRAPPPGVMTVSREQTSAWVRNFNPFTPPGAARFPTRAGVHEPLLIFNVMTGEYVPWLATAYRWKDGGLTLEMDIREGVKFSDGNPMSAADVVFTFQLLFEHPALDLSGIKRFVSAVEERTGQRVAFRFSRPYAPGLYPISITPIVPRHRWEHIEEPAKYSNPDPVGTGPFTEVRVFRNQIYELGRNPHYWQEGKPRIEALRFPAFPGNEQANMASVMGEVDWAANFVPAVERTYVSRDPEHHHYWFPLVGSTVFLYPNNLREPFGDVRVRKAMSLAIDRDKLVRVASYDYTRPSDPTGLSDAFESWRDPDVAARADWVEFDVERANRILDDAGYARDEDGVRRGPRGQRWEFTVSVVSGWTDWIRAAEVTRRNLRAIGIEVRVRTLDYGAWFDGVQKGEFDLTVAWSEEGPTPYRFYHALLSPTTVKPIGEPSAVNWHRYGSKKAEGLLRKFEAATDRSVQRTLARELQALFIESAPAIPLFPNPSWGTFNTRRFTGFPSADNPYARLSPNVEPECLFVLTEVAPRD